jgi:hypothetical protein
MLMNTKTSVAFSIVAIAAVIVLFASDSVAATQAAASTVASVAVVVADPHKRINKDQEYLILFLLVRIGGTGY